MPTCRAEDAYLSSGIHIGAAYSGDRHNATYAEIGISRIGPVMHPALTATTRVRSAANPTRVRNWLRYLDSLAGDYLDS